MRKYAGFAAAILLFSVSPIYSQILSVGIKAGVPLTDAYNTVSTGYTSATSYDRRYIIGPTVEVHLPLHLSVEVDALYRRNGFDGFFSGFGFGTPAYIPPSETRAAANEWQFPFLAKYEFKSYTIHPFADAGVVYRHVSAGNSLLNNPNGSGFAVGGGLRFKLALIRLSPEVRYTHWFAQPFNGPYVSSTANQADFLLGITF